MGVWRKWICVGASLQACLSTAPGHWRAGVSFPPIIIQSLEILHSFSTNLFASSHRVTRHWLHVRLWLQKCGFSKMEDIHLSVHIYCTWRLLPLMVSFWFPIIANHFCLLTFLSMVNASIAPRIHQLIVWLIHCFIFLFLLFPTSTYHI